MPPDQAGHDQGRRPTLYAYVLDELSLVSFLWRAARGEEIALVALRPIFPQAKRLLDRISTWVIRRYHVRWTIDYTPELEKDWRWNRNLYFQNVYGRCEAWQDAYFGLPQKDGETDDLAYAFNHFTANYVYDKAIEIYAIKALESAMSERDVVKAGISSDTALLYEAHFGEPLGGLRPRSAFVGVLANMMIAAISAMMALAWMIGHLRLKADPDDVFCIIDRIGNSQEEILIKELSDGGRIISYDRSGGNIDEPSLKWGTGRLILREFPADLAELVARFWTLWRRHGTLAPRHFSMVASLPSKAIRWRGLFNMCRPKHFIGRDEYNSDHVIRGGELSRIGAKSHGISGAVYAAYTDVAPNSRYVGYDHLYVIGTNVIIPARWRQSMVLHPIGTWGYSRAQLRGPVPPGDAILISVRIAFEIEEMIRITHAVAEAFPDKTVLLQMKPVTFISKTEFKELVGTYCRDHANIVLSAAPIYDLVDQAKYHISDISSLVAESIHRGAYCFVADVLGHESCCYRDFPGLCVETAADAVIQIQRIERGETQYPRGEYMKLLGLPIGTDPFDVIRGQVGLPPRENSGQTRPCDATDD